MFPSVISEGVLIKRRPSSHALLMGTSVRETVIMITLPIEKPTKSPSPSSRLIRIIIPCELGTFSLHFYFDTLD